MFEQSYIDMPKLYSDLFEVCDTSGFVIESMKSFLRKKLRWLMKNVMCRSISDFKCNNVHYTTKYDYPIIFEILKVVVERSDNHIICRWLNDSLKTKKDNIDLYECVEKIIVNLYDEQKIDEVTKDEWLDMVSISVNYEVSKFMIEIEQKIAAFEKTICTVPPNFKCDNTSYIDENENRHYLFKYLYDSLFNYYQFFDKKTVEELMNASEYQYDYVCLLRKFMDMIQESAESKIIERIKECIINFKIGGNINKATELLGPGDLMTSVTRQRLWFNKAHKYLIENPTVCKEIEDELKVSGIVDFFDVQNQ